MTPHDMARRIIVEVARRLYGVDEPVIQDLESHSAMKITDDLSPDEAARVAASALMQMLAFPALDADQADDTAAEAEAAAADEQADKHWNE